MPKYVDIGGQRFGLLVAQELAYRLKGRSFWLCQCDCGRFKVARLENLKSLNTRSCGCIPRRGRFPKTHGLTNHPSFQVWRGMVARCTNPQSPMWNNYGGRGITVCERWMTVENFIADMGVPPKGKSIDRINNDLGYSPENCRWATPQEQGRNNRRTRLITFKGVTKCITDWAKDIGLNQATIGYRLKHYSVEVALTTPRHRTRRTDEARRRYL